MAPRKHGQPASWEVDAHLPKPRGETRARRSYCTKELVLRPGPNINTVHDIMLYTGREFGAKEGFGTREVLEITSDERPLTRTDSSTSSKPTLHKSVDVYRLGPLKWTSYEDALQEVRDLGCGLRELGAGTRSDGQYFGFYASTSANWMFMAQACAFNGVPICTVYDSAIFDAIVEAFNEAKVPAIFTGAELLPNVFRILHRLPGIKLVVYDGRPDHGTLQAFKQFPNVRLIDIRKVREMGRKHTMQLAERAKRDDVYCLMYTSGGIGKPKGVLLTHGNVCAAVGSIKLLMSDALADETCYLAFLPQAHILEFAVEMVFMLLGIPIAYGRLKTLTDAGVRDCKNDIAEARPSVIVAVPTVWEIFRKGIQSKVDQGGVIKKTLFNVAMKAKNAAQEKQLPGIIGLSDALVFNRVKAATGGRLRTIFSGGGALSPVTQRFLSAALVQMIQGYGLTEGTAMACLLHPSWPTPGSVGGPVPGVEIKLVDRPDVGVGYYSTSDPPQGEVHLRGPAIFKGYFNSEFDKDAFTKDGWLITGDIGQWNPDGTLTIIDRIKNHVKLAGGKHILLERLESVYKSCPLLANGCVVAHPSHHNPAMVAVAHPVYLPSFARKAGIDAGPGDLEMLCRNDVIVSLVLRELNNTAKKNGLKGCDLLEALVLTADEWTPESGMLTAAQKLRRTAIDEYYADAINRVYTTTAQVKTNGFDTLKADVSHKSPTLPPLPPVANVRVGK